MSGAVISCVGAVIRDDKGRLLLVKRGHEPGAGLWSLPGGRIEPGETDAEALVREMREETGLKVEPGPLLGAVRRAAGDGDVLDIRDYAATVTGGTLIPGDDAADARWISAAELGSVPLTEGLVEALTSWGVLGQERQLSSYLALLMRMSILGWCYALTVRVLAFPDEGDRAHPGRNSQGRCSAGASGQPGPAGKGSRYQGSLGKISL